ncbi:MAG: hypothetical protein HKN29_13705 [Rhodothermales bacterium]|nr:hypothetical protein [Rhodothermales bacterium]
MRRLSITGDEAPDETGLTDYDVQVETSLSEPVCDFPGFLIAVPHQALPDPLHIIGPNLKVGG